MAPSANLHLQDDPFTDDSDPEPDSPAAAHYLPITADSDSDDNDVFTPVQLNGSIANHPNPNPSSLHIENGVAELHLDGSEGAEEEEEVEEEVEREEEVTARAFTEDESRRSAPLAPEAAARIVDAMRGVSFQGVPPVWLEEVPEERWVDQLRRLRVTPPEPDDSHLYSPWFYVHPVVGGDPRLVQMPEVQAPADDLPPVDTPSEELLQRLFLAHNVIRGGRQLLLSQTQRAGNLVGSLQQEKAYLRAQLDELTLRSTQYGVPLHGPFSYPGSQVYIERYQWGRREHNMRERGVSSRQERGESSRRGQMAEDSD